MIVTVVPDSVAPVGAAAIVAIDSNALLIEGAPITVIDAVLLVAPAPLSVELMTLVVLFCTPALAPVTVTLNEQVPLAASVPPLNEIMFGAVVVTVPPQVDCDPSGTVSPAGSVSVNAIPVRPRDELGLVIMKSRLVVPPTWMLDAPKDLLIVGGDATVSDAIAVLPVPPFPELTVTELFFTPDVVPVTLTTT